jgi:hypothetical protein
MSRVRADKFLDRAATGAPVLVYGAELPVGYGITGAGGINVTGVGTFSDISASSTGTITGNLKVGTGITMYASAGIVSVTSDINVGVNTSAGLVLKSPNGTAFRLIVSNAGALSAVSLGI